MDQHFESLSFQTFFDHIQKESVLEASAAQRRSTDFVPFTDLTASCDDLVSEPSVEYPSQTVRLFTLQPSQRDLPNDLLGRKDQTAVFVLTNSFNISLYALFVAILVPSVKESKQIALLVLITAVLNIVLSQFLGNWSLIVSTLVGAGIGMYIVDDEYFLSGDA